MQVADLHFPLLGDVMRADYAWPLWQALNELLPWLQEEDSAAILPLKGTTPGDGQLFLGKRAQLILRLPQERHAASAEALAGARLELGRQQQAELRLGNPSRRELRPTSAQYSPLVVLEHGDEPGFLRECERQLEAIEVSGSLVCGRQACLRGEEELRGYSLMLHGLSAEHSLRLQQLGLGRGRKLGCGIFVAHKTARAVATN